MKKRVFSALLALCLAFSLFGTALAATAETPSETASTSSSESTTVQENGTEVADSGDSSVSSTGETGNTGTDSSSEENADSNSAELTGTDTTGNDSQTDIDSQSDDAAATAADGAADDAATADATNETDSYAWGGQDGGGGSTSGNYSHIDVKTTAALTGTSDTRTVRSIESLTYRDASGQDRSVQLSSRPNSGEWTSNHGLWVPTDTTINIAFTLSDGNSYTSTITSSTTYPSGTYYPTTGDRYGQLTKYLGNRAEYVYSENRVVLGVDISGLSVFTVSSVVCNGADVSAGRVKVDGLDLVLNVATLLGTTPNFDFVVEKTLYGSNTLEEDQFTFTFQEANVSENTWTVSTADGTENQMRGTSAATNSEEGDTSITQTIDGNPVAYPTSSNEGTVYHYYILREIAGYETGVTYDDTIYGIVVAVKTKQTSLAGSSTMVYSTTVDSVQVYQLNASENGDYTQGEEITINNGDSGYVFPFTNTYDPGPETTTLTLQKTFVGLSDEEVYYLLYTQGNGSESSLFAFDVNYCDSDGSMYNFTESFEMLDGVRISNGGDFRIVASKYLKEIDSAAQLGNASNVASLENVNGNWVYSITINVPVCTDGTFFTVFEMHGELPGYAKLDTDSVTYTVSSDDTDNTTTNHTGSGKFVCDDNGDFDDMEDGASEENYISDGTFRRLSIQDDTKVSFQNRYSGSLNVTKEIGDTNEDADAEGKSYTLTIAPADIVKLDLSSSTGGVQHGLAGKTVSYTVTDSNGNTVNGNGKADIGGDGSFTVTIQANQTIHFTDLPAIQWKVTENDASVANYNWTVSYTDQNNDVEDDATHWNGYESEDTIGKTSETDGIASVDSVVSSDAVALVTVTNTYARKTNTLTISKHVSGPMGDTTEDFTFTVELTDTLDNNAAYTKEVENEKSTDSVGWSGSDGTYTLTLSDGESITLTLPYGVKATVEETNAQGHTVYSRVYDTGTTVSNEDFTPETSEKLGYEFKASQTVTLTGVNQSVDFMNYRAAAVPTAVDTDSAAPYLVLTVCAAFAGLALAGSIVAVRLRRRRQE